MFCNTAAFPVYFSHPGQVDRRATKAALENQGPGLDKKPSKLLDGQQNLLFAT
jgi:hypothetical protein